MPDEQMAEDHKRDYEAKAKFDEIAAALEQVSAEEGRRLSAEDAVTLDDAVARLRRRSEHIVAVWD